MSEYEIRECRLSDLRELSRTMREQDRAEIEGADLVVRHILCRLWRRSARSRVALIDGEVAAAWGDEGALLGEIGRMWCFTAPPIERLPLAFYREAKREIAWALTYRHLLIADVAETYEQAIRFFGMLGFSFGEPRPMPSGVMYRQMRIQRR